MKSYEAVTTVEGQGQVRLSGVPFAVGTEVQVIVSPKRRPAAEFLDEWKRVCAQLRARAGEVGDDEIKEEIEAHRGRA